MKYTSIDRTVKRQVKGKGTKGEMKWRRKKTVEKITVIEAAPGCSGQQLILKLQRESNPAEGTVTLKNWFQLPTVGLYII